LKLALQVISESVD